MGSAMPNPTGYDLARGLLQEVEAEARRSIAKTGEVDAKVLLDLIDCRLDCRHRDTMRLVVVAYLSRCLLGSVPDLSRWDPLL